MQRLFLSLMLACSLAHAGNFGMVPNVGKLITSDVGCNQCISGKTGTLLIRGASTATLAGCYDFSHTSNNFTALEIPDTVTFNTTCFIFGTNNSDHNNIAQFIAPQTVALAVDLKYNPLTNVVVPKVQNIAAHHAYFSHNSTLTSAGVWPVLSKQIGALVYSGDTGIRTINGTNFPVLVEVDCQFELDVMTGLTTVHLDTVTLVKGDTTCSGTDQSGILLGGDTALTTFTMDAAGLEWRGLLDADTTGITTFSMAGLTTLVSGFYFKQTRWHLSVASVNAWLAQLATVATASGVTSGRVDLRFQQPSGATPDATTGGHNGVAAVATLRALGVTVDTD